MRFFALTAHTSCIELKQTKQEKTPRERRQGTPNNTFKSKASTQVMCCFNQQETPGISSLYVSHAKIMSSENYRFGPTCQIADPTQNVTRPGSNGKQEF